MVIYAIGFVLTLIFSQYFIDEYGLKMQKSKIKLNRAKKIFAFLLAVFPLWFISAFRYAVGTDYMYTYVRFFKATQEGGKPYREPLFQVLNSLLVKLNLNYVWLFITSSALILIPIFWVIFKYSDNPILSICIFFLSAIYFNTLNNVRQYIAIAFGMYGIMQKKWPKALIAILIGSLFHWSGLLYIVLYCLLVVVKNVDIRKGDFFILFVVSIILAPIANGLIRRVLLTTHYGYFYGLYGGWSLLTVAINLVVFVVGLVYYDKKDALYKKYLFIQLLAVWLCFVSILANNEELYMRFIRMLAVFQILLIPKIVSKIKYSGYRITIAILLIAINAVYTAYTVVYLGGLEVFPYNFIFGRSIV